MQRNTGTTGENRAPSTASVVPLRAAKKVPETFVSGTFTM